MSVVGTQYWMSKTQLNGFKGRFLLTVFFNNCDYYCNYLKLNTLLSSSVFQFC